MNFLSVTNSVCSQCRKIVAARVVSENDEIWFHKICPDHGEERVFVRRGVEHWLSAQRCVKPAWIPQKFSGNGAKPCPEGCGMCPRHEQHLCLPIIEITSRCNLSCPVCIASAGEEREKSFSQNRDLGLETFARMLDKLVSAEKQIDILNFSGGEPLAHPAFLSLVDEALGREEIVRVSVSTNGLMLLSDNGLLEAIARRNIVVSIQYDGLDDHVYRELRGRPLATEKQRIIDTLVRENIPTTLTFTLCEGLNEHELPGAVELLFSRENILSMMIQPVSFSGRAETMRGKYGRAGIPDVTRLIDGMNHPIFRGRDFIPLPCSHPLCFSLAFYLITDSGRPVSVTSLMEDNTLKDILSNRVVFGLGEDETERLRDIIYSLWSGPAGLIPDGREVEKTVRRLLLEIDKKRCCMGPRDMFGLMERKIKSVFIHAFQDCDSFDLARVRRCCQGYVLPDGGVVSPCVYNVLGSRFRGK